jgi:hypothetical protein
MEQEATHIYGEGFSGGFARFQHTQEFWDVSETQNWAVQGSITNAGHCNCQVGSLGGWEIQMQQHMAK